MVVGKPWKDTGWYIHPKGAAGVMTAVARVGTLAGRITACLAMQCCTTNSRRPSTANSSVRECALQRSSSGRT